MFKRWQPALPPVLCFALPACEGCASSHALGSVLIPAPIATGGRHDRGEDCGVCGTLGARGGKPVSQTALHAAWVGTGLARMAFWVQRARQTLAVARHACFPTIRVVISYCFCAPQPQDEDAEMAAAMDDEDGEGLRLVSTALEANAGGWAWTLGVEGQCTIAGQPRKRATECRTAAACCP